MDEEPNQGGGQTPGNTTGGGNPIAAIIQAGAAITGSLMDANQSKKNAQRTINANREAADAAYQKDVEMWNTQNAYNSPEAQMARLKASGLNPNLVYGNGTVGNSSGSAPKYNPPTADYGGVKSTLGSVASAIPGVISNYQDFAMRQAQTDNVKANTDATRTKTINEAIKTGILGTKNQADRFGLSTKMELQPYNTEITKNRATQSQAEVEKSFQSVINMQRDELLKQYQTKIAAAHLDQTDIDREQKQANLLYSQYKNDWAKMGVTSSDNIVLRMLVRMVNESGLESTIMNWMKNKASNLMK